MHAESDIPERERKLICLLGRVEMAFRHIPAGEFRMGSRGHADDEEPIRRVKIKHDFWMAETPVTQAQFAVWTAAKTIKHKKQSEDLPEHPAGNVLWGEAVVFCRWIDSEYRDQIDEVQPGLIAALPNEARWEYACRANSETEFSSWDGAPALEQIGWFQGNSGTSFPPRNGPKNFADSEPDFANPLASHPPSLP